MNIVIFYSFTLNTLSTNIIILQNIVYTNPHETQIVLSLPDHAPLINLYNILMLENNEIIPKQRVLNTLLILRRRCVIHYRYIYVISIE